MTKLRSWLMVLCIIFALIALAVMAVPRSTEATTIASKSPTLLGNNTADPAALYYGGKYYVYGTGWGFPYWESKDGINYKKKGDSVKKFPSRIGGLHWAPDVVWNGKHFTMVFSAQDNNDKVKKMCIWRATSNSPAGPFTVSNKPFYCQSKSGYGAIDPSLFKDERKGAWYVLFRKGNVGEGCGIYSSWINSSHKTTKTNLLLSGNCGAGPANDKYIENPEMVRAPDGKFILFYSKGNWKNNSYKTGWATCSSPAGPCSPKGNLITSKSGINGPGGMSVARAPSNKNYVVFHGHKDGKRKLYGSSLTWTNGHTPSLRPAWSTVGTTHIKSATKNTWESPTDSKKHNEAVKVSRNASNGETLSWLHNIKVTGGDMTVKTSVRIDMIWLNKSKKVVKRATVCDYTGKKGTCTNGVTYGSGGEQSGKGGIKKENGQKIINNVSTRYPLKNLEVGSYVCQRVSWSASSYKDAQTGSKRVWNDGVAPTDWNCAKIIK